MSLTTHLLLISGSIGICCLTFSNPLRAQIVPDKTLPVNSAVTNNGNTTEITGGTQAGGNLFHSFDRFSVSTGTTAFFNNAPSIDNILTRVTGGEISNIDGTIRALGSANLFLLNPNGIAFGPNARLDIGGSFLASTASGVIFADGHEFLPANPQGQPLLTISVPLGLQMPGVPGSIVNQSKATDATGRPVGLQVQPGQTLALVGGNLDLAGGNLTAIQGQIELGSAVNGQVSLNPTASGLVFGYEDVGGFGNIQLSGGASVNASGLGGGRIQAVGGTVALTEGANIVADTVGNINGRGIEIRANQLRIDGGAFVSSSTFGDGNAGNLTVRATELVKLTGNGNIGDLLDKTVKQTLSPSDLANGLFSVSFSGGASGNLNIETERLVATQGAVASTISFGQGLGGNMNVVTTPTGSVELSNAGLASGTGSQQKSGDITIHTGRLLIQAGGLVATTAIADAGAGGNLTVTADSVELTGVSDKEFAIFSNFAVFDPVFLEPGPSSSGLFTLSLVDAGPAGDVVINTGKLSIRDGAIITTTTAGGASSGNVSIRASEFVELTGNGELQILEEILTGNIDSGDFRSGIFASSLLASKAGDVTIETRRLTVRDGGVVSTSTFGNDPGGNLRIDAPNGLVELIGGGLLTGTTGIQNSGELTINTDQLRIQKGGLVATSSFPSIAGAASAGDGGNVTLEVSDFLLLENSSIVANAVLQGRGGNINITTRGLFQANSTIDASSQLGVSGNISVNQPDAVTGQELINVPEQIIDPEQQISLSCIGDQEEKSSEFTITGRGGLPPGPSNPLTSQALVDFDTTAEEPGSDRPTAQTTESDRLPPPATGWYLDPQGNLMLTSRATNSTPQNPQLTPPDCRHAQ